MEKNESVKTCIKPEGVPYDDSRIRILGILKLLQEETDEYNHLTTPQIQKRILQTLGIRMHRTRVPIDMSVLAAAGFDIRAERGRGWSYYLEDKGLSPAEIRLLTDAVRASRFIGSAKSAELSNKLESLNRRKDIELSDRIVRTPGKAKSENELGYPAVDIVCRAIKEGKKISFPYFSYNANKEAVLKNEGEPYVVSPFDMVWEGDCYYLIGYCDQRSAVRVFRADRIAATPDILNEAAVEKPAGYLADSYVARAFRMYGADEAVDVTLLCDGSAMNTVVDHFGLQADTTPTEDGKFLAKVNLFPSPMFLRWVFGSAGSIRILGPEQVRQDYRNMLLQALEQNDAQ